MFCTLTRKFVLPYPGGRKTRLSQSKSVTPLFRKSGTRFLDPQRGFSKYWGASNLVYGLFIATPTMAVYPLAAAPINYLLTAEVNIGIDAMLTQWVPSNLGTLVFHRQIMLIEWRNKILNRKSSNTCKLVPGECRSFVPTFQYHS